MGGRDTLPVKAASGLCDLVPGDSPSSLTSLPPLEPAFPDPTHTRSRRHPSLLLSPQAQLRALTGSSFYPCPSDRATWDVCELCTAHHTPGACAGALLPVRTRSRRPEGRALSTWDSSGALGWCRLVTSVTSKRSGSDPRAAGKAAPIRPHMYCPQPHSPAAGHSGLAVP